MPHSQQRCSNLQFSALCWQPDFGMYPRLLIAPEGSQFRRLHRSRFVGLPSAFTHMMKRSSFNALTAG